MAFQFPWTNFHELNLDWFLSKFKQFANNFLETTATVDSVPYGTQPSVTVTGGELDDDTDITNPFNFNFKIPAGQQGAQGAPGQDGFSPVATVTKSGDTATITITDENGTTTATVSDGVGFSDSIRPSYSAFIDEITAVKTYPENNGRLIAVNKNHVTVTRTDTGTSYATMSLIGNGTHYETGSITSAKVKALYDAGEFLPRTHYLYNFPDNNKKWYFNISFSRPAGSDEGGAIFLTAYDTVNETYRYLASMDAGSGFVQNESSISHLVDLSTLTGDEVIMLLYYRRSGNTSFRGVAMQWDWSLESARGIMVSQTQQDSNLAWVEDTTTASRAYAVGDFVTINGVLCKITATVANGGTLISGTNYTVIGGNGGFASTFNSEVDNDPCNALSSPFSSPLFSLVLIRCGKIRILTGDLSASSATSSGDLITTLKNAKDFPITDVLTSSGNGGSASLGLRIKPSGEIVTYGAATSSKTYQAFSIVYCV